MMLVQDTKRPNKDPFEISQIGYDGLVQRFGKRYQPIKQAIVTPGKIEVTKGEFVNPAKTKRG